MVGYTPLPDYVGQHIAATSRKRMFDWLASG